MPINRVRGASNKKRDLLERKQKILETIKYYDKRISEDSAAKESIYCYDDSSDSDEEAKFRIDLSPSIEQLKDTQQMLRVGLNAMKELAGLEVLQSECKVLVEDPVFKSEAPVVKPGLWREVTAECQVDLVPYSINFCVHQATGIFGAKSYRGLNVLPVKRAQEAELSRSVLMKVTNPADAMEVLRSYSVSFRSRRATLARLADTYPHHIYMEPLPDGGFRLKCTNLLELTWKLENARSPLAAFRHKFVFELEHIDEVYLKIIRKAHTQLSNPTLDTDERTLLLAKIISTCLEAEKRTQENLESESKPETSRKLEKRRITLDTDATATKKNKNDNENAEEDDKVDDSNEKDKATDDQVMAPPKSLPKKSKPKGKENIDHNRKAVKRSTGEVSAGSVKKAKIDDNNANKKCKNDNGQIKVVNDKVNNAGGSQKIPTNVENMGKKRYVQGNSGNKPTQKGKENIKLINLEELDKVTEKNTEAKTVKPNSNNAQRKDNLNKIQEIENKQEGNKTNKALETQKVVEDVIVSKTNSQAQKQVSENKINVTKTSVKTNLLTNVKQSNKDKDAGSKLEEKTKKTDKQKETDKETQIPKNAEKTKKVIQTVANKDRVTSAKNDDLTKDLNNKEKAVSSKNAQANDKNNAKMDTAIALAVKEATNNKMTAISLAASVAAKQIAVKTNVKTAGNPDKGIMRNKSVKTQKLDDEEPENSTYNTVLTKTNKNSVNKTQNELPKATEIKNKNSKTNTTRPIANKTEKHTIKSIINKNTKTLATKNKINENLQSLNKNMQKANLKSKSADQIINQNAPRTSTPNKMNTIQNGKNQKQIFNGSAEKKNSKIPLLNIPHRLSAIKKLTNNPLRISPRKFTSIKSISDSNLKKNISKLLNNPTKIGGQQKK